MLISHVCQKRRLPRIMINLFAHMTVKVTIGTFGYAKGPMDIKRKPLPIRSLCGYCRGGGVKRHYERSGLIKTGFYQFVERIGAVAHLVLVLWVQFRESLLKSIRLKHRIIAKAQCATRRPYQIAIGASLKYIRMAIGPCECECANKMGAAVSIRSQQIGRASCRERGEVRELRVGVTR